MVGLERGRGAEAGVEHIAALARRRRSGPVQLTLLLIVMKGHVSASI